MKGIRKRPFKRRAVKGPAPNLHAMILRSFNKKACGSRYEKKEQMKTGRRRRSYRRHPLHTRKNTGDGAVDGEDGEVDQESIVDTVMSWNPDDISEEESMFVDIDVDESEVIIGDDHDLAPPDEEMQAVFANFHY